MQIIYMGTGTIGIPTLTALLDSKKHQTIAVITQPDRPAGRSFTTLHASAIKMLALERGVPVLQPEILQTDWQHIVELEPDLIVVMAYGQIVPRRILQLPKVACINLHPSLLPRHRGASPIHAALLCGDTETGITVTYMNHELDSGDILLKEALAITSRETNGHLQARLAKIAPPILMQALNLLEQGSAPRIPQNPALITYAPKLTKRDAHLCWKKEAEILDRQIRAMNPWPGAFCLWERNRSIKRVQVLEAEPIIMEDGEGIPGEVMCVGKEGIMVRCSRGSLLMHRLHLEGKKSMPATEFIQGAKIQIGDILG